MNSLSLGTDIFHRSQMIRPITRSGIMALIQHAGSTGDARGESEVISLPSSYGSTFSSSEKGRFCITNASTKSPRPFTSEKYGSGPGAAAASGPVKCPVKVWLFPVWEMAAVVKELVHRHVCGGSHQADGGISHIGAQHLYLQGRGRAAGIPWLGRGNLVPRESRVQQGPSRIPRAAVQWPRC